MAAVYNELRDPAQRFLLENTSRGFSSIVQPQGELRRYFCERCEQNVNVQRFLCPSRHLFILEYTVSRDGNSQLHFPHLAQRITDYRRPGTHANCQPPIIHQEDMVAKTLFETTKHKGVRSDE